MSRVLASLCAGFLFGIGLALSKMIDPNKVINFLDIAGNWDPSLALVMGGALSITLVAFRVIPKRAAPLFDDKFRLPTRRDIDKPLLGGATLFGIGWGMAGYCPGPAIASLGMGFLDPAILVLAMVAGFTAHRFITEKN